MAKRCIPCLSPEVKQILSREIKDKTIREVLDQVATCTDGSHIQLCEVKPRGRSVYQEFVSQCMKSKNIKGFGEAPKAMKECATQWRNRSNQDAKR